MVKLQMPDGAVREVPRGTTAREVAAQIARSLAARAIVARLGGQLVEMSRPILEDGPFEILGPDSADALAVLRHSTAHATAQAVQELFPGTRIGQGPVIEDGFYYDFDRDSPFTDGDLAAIEARMREIVARDLPIERLEVSREEAIERFRRENEPYKLYFVTTKGGDTVTLYRQGEWSDFCRGPHVSSTGRLAAFKLLSVAGAYWLGDEKNKMLQRIYGTAFFSQRELDEHLALLEEAKRRDHRKLGRELGLFSFHPEAPASPFFHPRGAAVYNSLLAHVRELYRSYGYTEIITPQIFDASLWKRSGHYDHYRDHMFFTTADKREYAVKPMNCPAHCLLYGEGRHSYRELPMRLADFGRLHRYELSGAIAGLTRVRSFAQDDAHIFCTPDQIGSEVASVTRMILDCYALFGFDVRIRLATRPAQRAGDDALWDRAEAALADALERSGHAYTVHPGDGAFYGPKVDFVVKDALRREHQLGTIQLDYNLPERFDLRYIDAQDREQRPVMIHRAMLGSLERFLGILIEHTAGAFPLWLAPEQVRILTITDRVTAYATAAASRLGTLGVRVETDLRNEKIGAKIRDAQRAQVPLMLVVGDREAAEGTVAVRSRRGGDRGPQALDAFAATALEWIQNKTIEA